MEKQVIATKNAPAAIGPYSQAIRSGDFVYCSGQIPLDPTTGKLIEGTVQDDVIQIFANIKAVLKESGLTLENVIKTTIFLKSMDTFVDVNEIYGKYFKEPYPARSTVEVSKLPLNCRVEIEVIARG